MAKGFNRIATVIGQAVLLVGLVSVVGYAVVYRNLSENVKLPAVDDCKLQQQPCSTELPTGAKIEFEISPKNPAPTDPLYLTARFKNINPDSVSVAFDGKTMKMGLLQYDLKKAVSEDPELIEYAGGGGLSVCVIGKMEWQVLVKLAQGDNTYEIPFEMDTFYGLGASDSE